MSGECIFVLGGARSGKSRFAEELALQRPGPVLYVATATATDEEMARRISLHRARRPAPWRTLEAPTCVAEALLREAGDAQAIIVDCLSLLVNNLVMQASGADPERPAPVQHEPLEARVRQEVEALISCVEALSAAFIVVSNEVGAGVVPPYPLGRIYRDLLGFANQMLAQRADTVYYMVAGLPLRVKPAATGG